LKFTTKALKHWKSSASNLLTLGLVTCGALLSVPGVISQKHAAVLMAVQGIAKGWIGLIQEDAGVVEAKVPGESGTQMVPAHEVPNDPAATPVSETK
jgi:hypothetical protein